MKLDTPFTSVTELKRKATEVIAKAQQHKRPILITEHGRPAAFLVDAETYLQDQDRIEVTLAIMEGELDLAAGRTYTNEEVMDSLEKIVNDAIARKKKHP